MTLTQSELTQLVSLLEERYAALLTDIRDELEHGENQQYIELLGRTPGDAGDRSIADLLADLNLGLIDRHVRELRDIDAATAGIQEGTFGRCVDCGSEIAFERLRACPSATRCVLCQGQREHTFAHEGRPTL